MADNLTLFNTDYTGVTGIKAKGTGNGMLTYIRPRGTKTITENGTVDISSYMNVEVNVSSGDSENRSNPIRFFDYDGTLVASYTSVPDSLPNIPTHDRLTNGTWNYTLEQISSQYAAIGACDIGANYDTASGKNEIDVTFDDPNLLSPYLAFAVNGTAIIDWGDGSATDTITGTSFSTLVFVQHTYTQTGDYTIMIDGPIRFYNDNNYSLSVLRTVNDTSNRRYSQAYSRCMTAVRVANGSRIGNYAFQYCYSLTSVSIPFGITSIGSYAFQYCYNLTSISIPSSVTYIGSYTFFSCYSLISITIPNKVARIESNAFQNCYNLTSVTIPNSVTDIGNNAFNNCYSLTSVSISDSVTSIGQCAFQNCYNLTNVTIPNSVTRINSSAFQNCYNLKSITIPNNITKIDSLAFHHCENLISITIPDSVTDIGNNAFGYCYNLTSVSISDSVTNIGQYAFQNCYNLTNVTIPNSVTRINSSAFQYCYNLKSITIPNSVTSIFDYAFGYCYSLQVITIPSSVTSIKDNAFSRCYGTYEYHLKSTTPPTLATKNAFSGIALGAKIYVPAGSLEAYQTATNWSTYANYMVEE